MHIYAGALPLYVRRVWLLTKDKNKRGRECLIDFSERYLMFSEGGDKKFLSLLLVEGGQSLLVEYKCFSFEQAIRRAENELKEILKARMFLVTPIG